MGQCKTLTVSSLLPNEWAIFFRKYIMENDAVLLWLHFINEFILLNMYLLATVGDKPTPIETIFWWCFNAERHLC